MSLGEGWKHLLHRSPSSLTPRDHGQPRSLALLAITEWMGKGKDLWDHPGQREVGPERRLGFPRRAELKG